MRFRSADELARRAHASSGRAGGAESAATPDAAELVADVCVVGAGAAGLAIALELDRSPLRVCVLESGGLGTGAIDGRASGGEQGGEHAFENVGRPLNADWPLRRRGFGGTTASWFGRCALLDAWDFETRAWVPDSGWPIARSEIETHLEAAAVVLGVAPLESLDPLGWDDHAVCRTLAGAEVAVRVHRVTARPRLGRTYRAALERSRNVDVVLEATATRLEASDSGERVALLHARSGSGQSLRVRARGYVLAGGGIENARLLLLSRRGDSAAVGNDHDQVGRRYLNHPRAEGVGRLYLDPRHPLQRALLDGLLLAPRRALEGRLQLALAAQREWLERRRLTGISTFFYAVNGALERWRRSFALLRQEMARDRLSRPAIAHALRLVAAAPPVLAAAASRRALRVHSGSDFLVLVDQVEQVPDPASRVTLADRRDRFGLPLARLDWRFGPEVAATHRAFHRALAEGVERAGVGRLESPLLDGDSFEPDYTDCSHPMGTTRMHDDPRHGVVDARCRVHGVDNLWIAGSSVFPTGGHAAPTLTLVALAIRLGRHLASVLAGR